MSPTEELSERSLSKRTGEVSMTALVPVTRLKAHTVRAAEPPAGQLLKRR